LLTWKINTYYTLACWSVTVTLLKKHGKRIGRIILSSVACEALIYLSALSHKRYNFREKVTEHKKLFSFSIQLLRTVDFWVITQRVVVISYRRFGVTYRSHPQGSRIQRIKNSWTLRMGPIGCPETSVRNYLYSLRNNPEERSSQLLRHGSLKSRLIQLLSKTLFILRQIRRGIITNAHRCSLKYQLFLSDFNETLIFPTDFRKMFKYQIPLKSVQWEPSCSMRRATGQTDTTKLTVDFCNSTD